MGDSSPRSLFPFSYHSSGTGGKCVTFVTFVPFNAIIAAVKADEYSLLRICSWKLMETNGNFTSICLWFTHQPSLPVHSTFGSALLIYCKSHILHALSKLVALQWFGAHGIAVTGVTLITIMFPVLIFGALRLVSQGFSNNNGKIEGQYDKASQNHWQA